MTREEAIKFLTLMRKAVSNFEEYGHDKARMVIECDKAEAIDMAIEALTEPKTIIGIDIPYGSDKGIATLFKSKDDKLILEEVKEIMSVVRCKDCRHYDNCWLYEEHKDDNGTCVWAESNSITESPNDVVEKENDVIEVVRCKDCKWYMLTDHNETEVCTNKQWDISMAVYPIISADDFCSYGERKEP